MKPVAPVRAMRGLLAAPTGFNAALRRPQACAVRPNISHWAGLRGRDWRDSAAGSEANLAMIRSGPERSRQAFGSQGGLDVGRRDVAVVPADSGVAAVRGGGHSDHAGISGAEMGVCAAHGVYWRSGCVPLRAWLPRAAAGTA